MIPETCYRDEICLLECVEFPSRWEKSAVLLKGIHAVDTTVFLKDGNCYCFIYSFNAKDSSDRKLFIGNLDWEAKTISKMQMVAHYHNSNGRPGGNCFIKNNEWIRVVQPGIRFYGERIDYYHFSYSDGNYTEELVSSLDPTQIKVKGVRQIDGIHTYNKVDCYEIIDVRINRFDLFKPFKWLFRKLKLFGYDNGDKRKGFYFI